MPSPRGRERAASVHEEDEHDQRQALTSPTSPAATITLMEVPYSSSIDSIPELSPASQFEGQSTPTSIDAFGAADEQQTLDQQQRDDQQPAPREKDGGGAPRFLDGLGAQYIDEEDDEDDEDSDQLDVSPDDEIDEHALQFRVSRATVTRTGVLPCCVFVGRVAWRSIEWEVYFGQKQLIRLHLSLLANLLYQKRRGMRGISLPWTVWREKRAEKRVADAGVVQDYICALLADRDIRNSDPMLSFLEVSPSRAMSRYGPSLKEGYVHMRMNGAFQLPLYSCVNRTIEAFYRHLYRTWMRIAFISVVVTFILPVCLIIVSALPRFFVGQKVLINEDEDDLTRKTDAEQVLLGIVTLSALLYMSVFVYKFFDHRLGVIRRWVVLKPNCFAAYRKRWHQEPSEVFLFDKKFTARKGSYRQGVSWMPSGFVIGSNAGFIEVDTGHYYTRLTMGISLLFVCWGVFTLSNELYRYENVSFSGGLHAVDLPEYQDWTPSGEDTICGYYFEVPSNVSVQVRTSDSDAVISTLRDADKNETVSAFNFLLGGDDLGYRLGGFLANTIGKGSLVAVTKKLAYQNDTFISTGVNVTVDRIGTLTLLAINGSTLTEFNHADNFCTIPIDIAIVDWALLLYYIPMLLVGGMVTSTSGLLLNYLITYLGLWHAHVRRDHWYRCIKRLQKLKRQQTEFRYHSFAPEHVSVPKYECPLSPLGTDPPLSTRTKATSDGSVHSASSSIELPAVATPSSIAWHVDGEDTYAAMYSAMKDAKFEILIAGWWVTPDLYLLRPGRKLPPREGEYDKKTNATQLRELLLLKAQEGVKINVLIYREVKLALTLNSAYTKRSLKLHPNIRVIRDPIFQIQSLGFWSHHEKIVCVDQSLAFIGGLDLCFGRYDHSGHPLSDPGGDDIANQTWPGKDYSNPIIKDFVRVDKPFEDLIDRSDQPRMPWHDVHCSVSGPPVRDIAYHYIQRWNFVCSKNDYQLRTGWCICLRSRRFKYLPKCLLPMDFTGWKLRYPASDAITDPSASTMAPVLVPGESMEIVSNEFDVIDTTGDELSSEPQSPTPANWGSTTGGNRTSPPTSSVSTGAALTIDSKFMKPDLRRDQRCASMAHIMHSNSQNCNVQVARSVSMWSAGVPTETSIHQAYLDVISKSKHFIYIENQFFISGLHSNGVVSNRILQALVDRIERAVKANEVFRVFVVMPLLPAFEGNIRSEELTNLHAVMHWQFETISRGKHSLFAALARFTSHPETYVSFFGLRKYGILPNGRVSTEQIYIHSKLMIADDRYVILGSANINDRSMTGYRDSEIALVIEDMQFEEGTMNNQPYRRGVVAGSLRRQLFREHLGLAEDDTMTIDPVAEWSYQHIRGVAHNNTQIFEAVFDCAPSNRMKSFKSFNNIEVTQIFENQRLNVLKRGVIKDRGRHVWDKENLKEGDYAAWTDVNGVPINMDEINMDDFILDRFKDRKRKHIFSMDHDGWCYARNFSVFQEVRMHNFRKRDKLQHFMTDRLIAPVRRRRWVRKDSNLVPSAMSRNSSFCESSDDEDNGSRLHSLWRRLRRSESAAPFPRANSLTSMGNAHPGGSARGFRERIAKRVRPSRSLTSSMVLSGEASYPNSPTTANFRASDESPSSFDAEAANIGDTTIDIAPRNRGYRGSMPARRPHDSLEHINDPDDLRGSTDSGRGINLTASLRKWASFMEGGPREFSRRSRFADEYFSQDDDGLAPSHDNDEPLLEPGWRGSVRSVNSSDMHAQGGSSSVVDPGECQIGHLKTAATVSKEDEVIARNKLSAIQGHLVEFPVHFLAGEMLKPSIMPADIHI